MARKKAVKKEPTEFSLNCACKASAPIFELERGYMAHCPDCGAITFFDNPALLKRLSFGGDLCPHHPERKPCRGGHTTWCPTCKIRTFYYGNEEKNGS